MCTGGACRPFSHDRHFCAAPPGHGFIGLGTASALAADLAARPYTKAPAISPAYNWTGFYIGAMGGYGWSENVNVAGITVGTNDIKGGFVGGTLGYNWQTPGSPFVFGIEADGAWSDIKFADTFLGVTSEDKIRSFGSVTGRLGYAVNTALLYFKGGYAWADNRFFGYKWRGHAILGKQVSLWLDRWWRP